MKHLDGAAVEVREHLAGHDLLRRPDPEAAAGEVEHAVDVVDDGVDLVGDEDDGAVLLVALPVDQPADRLLVVQVKGEQRLVTQEDARLGGQGLGDAQALLFPARQPPDGGVGIGGRADLGEQRVDRVPVSAAPRARSGVSAGNGRCWGM
jgi:hypothetical protein